ncbi:MAG: glycoside hydrolase family 97 protein [Bacteroidaceae bacterium]
MKHFFSITLFIFALGFSTVAYAEGKIFKVVSPDGRTTATIKVAERISYSISQDGTQVLAPSFLSMTLSDATVWGLNANLKKSAAHQVNKKIKSPFYMMSEVPDIYNDLSLTFSGDWGIDFRAYNDGIAYRFNTTRRGAFEIAKEQVDFQFVNDAVATVPYVRDQGTAEFQLFESFENLYTTLPLSQLDKNRLMFLPLTVQASDGRRVTITESDLRDYPGMYLVSKIGNNTLQGLFAACPKEVQKHAGYNNLQVIVKSREPFIARVSSPRTFPWRVAIVTSSDAELANTTMTYKLAAPSEIKDISWIKPGKVAWDWWNDWNLEGVKFKTGVNTETYKYYIDFASKQGIEYVILDEGWSVNKVYDLMQVVPQIDMPEIVKYAKERNVGIILWAGYYAFDRDMENVCKHYSEMGVKGFKVDFMNRDDQDLVAFNERAAKMCAKYHLLLDLHGMYKPAGINRTYPNILNCEGVHGLEQMKWKPATCDQVTYDTQIPYLRMIAGPMDYTQGATHNAVKGNYYPCSSEPMSQGTRCHQIAEYVVFLSPLNMLCDSPTNYEKNPIFTAFIASIPTVWDETKTIQGEMGKYIVTARRSGKIWYIGGLNNWDARDITLDVAKITGKVGEAEIFQDGINADRKGTDFIRREVNITKGSQLTIHVAPGGGFAVKL